MPRKTEFVGSSGAAFARVSLAFQSLGYRAPTPDSGSTGAYVLNIIEQYRADLSEEQTLDVISYGLRHSRAWHQDNVARIGTPSALRMRDI